MAGEDEPRGSDQPDEQSLDEVPVAPAHAARSLDEAPAMPGRPVQPGVEQRDYDPTEDREKKRGQIALILVWMLAGIIIGGFLVILGRAFCIGVGGTAVCEGLKVVEVRTLIEMLLTPIVGLVGAVTGFYFGEKKS